MKRKLQVLNSISVKRQKFNDNKNLYITASQLRNYMLNDTLSDWLDVYEKEQRSQTTTSSFIPFLMQKGNDFEDEIIKKIHSITPVTTISDAFSSNSIQKVKELMEKRTPIISNAPLINENNKTKGIADLIIRNDVLKSLFEVPIDEDTDYSIIDIKYSTVPILKNGSISNTKSMPAYKSQIRIYTEAMGSFQKISRYGYILGKRYKKDGKILDSLDTLGVIDYDDVDKLYIKKTQDAVDWYRSVLTDGWQWHIGCKKELLPNMCVFNYRWQARKQEITNESRDVTGVWRCGVRQRENLSKIGIQTWDDPRCNAYTMGFSKKSSYYKTINTILRVNKRNKEDYLPKKLKRVVPSSESELFVDFETVPSIVSGLERSIIFMIGVGKVINKKWCYTTFCVENLSLQEELHILRNFKSYVYKHSSPILYYWHAEENILRQSHFNLDVEYFDLCKLFQKEPIVIRGCLNFGLKNIAKCLKKLELIQTSLEDEKCQNGMSAMLMALNLDKNRDSIQKYNEFDCKVLYEILLFVRSLK